MSLVTNHTKYSQTKVANFTIDKLNHGFRIMTQKCIQHILKKFIRTLKNKIYKQMISLSKVVYIDKLDVIVEAEHFARCSLLSARCQLIFACCSLLFAHSSLPFARCSLPFARCSLVFARCLFLFACCLLLFACYSMLQNLTNETLPQKFSLQISEISKFFWMVVFRVTNIVSTDITLMSLLQYLDTLSYNLCTGRVSSSHPKKFYEKGVVKNSTKFTEKLLRRGLFCTMLQTGDL